MGPGLFLKGEATSERRRVRATCVVPLRNSSCRGLAFRSIVNTMHGLEPRPGNVKTARVWIWALALVLAAAAVVGATGWQNFGRGAAGDRVTASYGHWARYDERPFAQHNPVRLVVIRPHD